MLTRDTMHAMVMNIQRVLNAAECHPKGLLIADSFPSQKEMI